MVKEAETFKETEQEKAATAPRKSTHRQFYKASIATIKHNMKTLAV